MRRFAAAVTIWLGLAGAAAAQDIMKKRDGTEIKGKITVLTSKEIVYLDGVRPTNMKAAEVVEVKLGEVSDTLRAARELANAKKWDDAIAKFEAAMAEVDAKKARDLHKPFILLEWSKAFESKGDGDKDKDKAKESFGKALEKLNDLLKNCGDCWVRSDAARRAIEVARKIDESALMEELNMLKGEAAPVGGQAELELAKLKFSKGEYDEAAAIFMRLSEATDAAYVIEARIWSIKCLRMSKKWDDLETACSRILDDRTNNPPSLIQAAGAALGDLLLQKAEKDKTKLRDALIACAKAIAVGPPQRGEQAEKAEDYVLALFDAGKCYVAMYRDVKDDAAKKKYAERARDYFGEIVRSFSKAALFADAQKELDALGEKQDKQD